MAAADFRSPTEKEVEILLRNGIKPEGLAVKRSNEDVLHVLRHCTRDDIIIHGNEIIIHRGDKKW